MQQQHQFSDNDALSHSTSGGRPTPAPYSFTVERMADIQVTGFGLRKEDYNVSKTHSSSSSSSSCAHSEHFNHRLTDYFEQWNPINLDEECSTLRQKGCPLQKHSGGNRDQLTQVVALETRKLVDALEEAYSKIPPLVSESKSLFNELLAAKGSVKVFCRARPISAGQGPSVFEFPNDFTLRIRTVDDDFANLNKDFEFDRVFEPHVKQEIIFADVQPFVQSALDGCDVTVFAFGQTGSGKTYTMLGSDNDLGLYDQCFEDLIYSSNSGANAKTMLFEFFVSIYGIRHDQLRDFLSDDSVLEPSRVKIHDPFDFSELLKEIFVPTNDLKCCEFTHIFVTIHICSTNLITGEKFSSKLSLAELAATEDLRVSDDRKFANFLSGDVLGALPVHKVATFETSLFAKTLADTCGGKSKTVMIVNLCPEVSSLPKTLFFLNLFSRGIENREAIKKLRADDSQCNVLLDRYKMERNTNIQLNAHLHQLKLKEQEQKLLVQDRESLIQELQSKRRMLDLGYEKIAYKNTAFRRSNNYLSSLTQSKISDENILLEGTIFRLKQKQQEQSLQIQQRDSVIQKLEDKLKSIELQHALDSSSSSQSRCSAAELSKQDALVEERHKGS